jgi:hypothetical protein
MTLEEKIQEFNTILGSDDAEDDATVVTTYLNKAKERILNHRFPHGTSLTDVEPQYEHLQIELAISLYNQRGVEGQEKHSENGVSRSWRSPNQILESIPRRAGIPQ